MKITDVKLIYAKHYLFVHIYTDEGIVGLGEAGNWGHLMATAEAIKKFSTYLIGKDPSRIDDIGQNLYRSLYFRGSVIMSAISAIDIALWDIKGKKLGVPVYELLGGKTRDKVRVYASPMHKETDPEALKRAADLLFQAGRVLCMGQGSSMVLAEEAWTLLSSISPKFVLVPDSHQQMAALALMEEGDAALYFSYSGSTE